MKNPVTAGSVLRDIVNQLGLKPALSRHRIIHLWPKIVDTVVASHAKAEKVVGSTLHVVVDSSVWMNEMAAVKSILLEKINACLEPGAAPITDIRFQQRSWAKSNPPTATVIPTPKPTDKDERMMRRILEPITDQDLKTLLTRILEKDQQLKSSRESQE